MPARVPRNTGWSTRYSPPRIQGRRRTPPTQWRSPWAAAGYFGQPGIEDVTSYWQTERRQLLKAYEGQLENVLRHVREAIADLEDDANGGDDEPPATYAVRGRYGPPRRRSAPRSSTATSATAKKASSQPARPRSRSRTSGKSS
jgi:hypothetical protein